MRRTDWKMLRFCWTSKIWLPKCGETACQTADPSLSPGGNVALAFFRRGQSTVPKVSHQSESPFGFLRSQVRPQVSGFRMSGWTKYLHSSETGWRCWCFNPLSSSPWGAWQLVSMSSDHPARDIGVFYSWTYNLNAGVCLQRKVMNEWPQ